MKKIFTAVIVSVLFFLVSCATVNDTEGSIADFFSHTKQTEKSESEIARTHEVMKEELPDAVAETEPEESVLESEPVVCESEPTEEPSVEETVAVETDVQDVFINEVFSEDVDPELEIRTVEVSPKADGIMVLTGAFILFLVCLYFFVIRRLKHANPENRES